jgi:hypothetical protein
MAIHKFKFAQVPLASVKKLLLEKENSVPKQDLPLRARKLAPTAAPSTTRSRSKT